MGLKTAHICPVVLVRLQAEQQVPIAERTAKAHVDRMRFPRTAGREVHHGNGHA